VSRQSSHVSIKSDEGDTPDSVGEPDVQCGSLLSAELTDVEAAAAAKLEPRKTLAGFKASRRSRYVPIESERPTPPTGGLHPPLGRQARRQR
jgi:hypothetical protein